jgi:hypothetical protein
MISLLLSKMDSIGKPIQVNRKFIKFIKEEIQPEYERVLEVVLEKLKQEMDKKYLNNEYTDKT